MRDLDDARRDGTIDDPVGRALEGPVGLAFGGGGARGIAHVGVLSALETYPGIVPRMFAGTSAGAVIAVLAAAGTGAEDLREFVVDLDWFSHVIKIKNVVDIATGPRGGLFPNARLAEIVNERIGGRSFDDLPHDVAVTATDIERKRRVIITGRRVAARLDRDELHRFFPPPDEILTGGETVIVTDVDDVGLAIRASCAVPGVFKPVVIDDMHLVDGGLVDQTPVDIVRAMGSAFSIGISLGLAFMPERLSNVFDAISGTIGMLGIPQLRHSLEIADVGFTVTGIEERSPVKPRQTDLIDIAAADTHRALERVLGPAGVERARS